MSFFDYPGQQAGVADDAQVTVLEHLNSDDWQKVISHAQTVHFSAGETLIEYGDRDDSLYILVEGEIEVLRQGSFGRRRTITRIPAGSVFGEIAFFDQQPRSAIVQARSDGSMLRITRRKFEQMAAWEPRIARDLLLDLGKVMATRLRSTTMNNG